MDVSRPNRTELRRQRTRRRLREVAYERMSQQGVDATSIQQITDAADIGFGTFYNYYASKEALAQDVLDCLIHNIGERNDAVTRVLGETDPVCIVANSVRFVVREVVQDPVFRWWAEHLELLVDRMRIGFGPFGLRDIARAVEADAYRLIGNDEQLAWSQLVWLMAAGGRDILHGHHKPAAEAQIVEGILRVMGVEHERAALATARALIPSPELPIDFDRDFGAEPSEPNAQL